MIKNKISKTDGWANTLTGIGVLNKDRRLSMQATWEPLDITSIENIYGVDPFARRIIEIIPQEAFKDDLILKSSETKSIETVEKFKKFYHNLKVREKFEKAWIMGRLYGGATIVMVTDQQDMSLPLNFEKPGILKSLHIFNKQEMTVQELESDIESSNYGQPKSYMFQPYTVSTKKTGVIIHHSRVLRFDGETLPRQLYNQNSYYHDSVINKIQNALRNYHMGNDSLALAVGEFKSTILKLKDLPSLLQEETGKSKLLERIEIMNLCKSVLGSLVIDAEMESIENLGVTLSGVPESVEKINNMLCAAVGIPKTILFGLSPAGGLSGKGESEARDFYDNVHRMRTLQIAPKLDVLFKIMQNASNSPTGGKEINGFYYEFPSLWQLDDIEKANIRKTMAESDQIYFSSGILSPDEIRKSRFKGDEFSIETQLDENITPNFSDVIE